MKIESYQNKVVEIMKEFTKEQKYLRAQKQVDKLKGFYANVASYCIVIPFLVFINLRFVPEFYWFWFPMFGWGMGLAFHAMDTYNYNPFLGRNWEEKKIREMMEEEEKYKRYK